jgi:uncharacterized protein
MYVTMQISHTLKPKRISILIGLFLSSAAFPQNRAADDNSLLLHYKDPVLESKYAERDINFSLLNNKTLLARINPVNWGLSGLMFVYKKSISPQISANCLYNPSCSSYSKALFSRYGLLKSVFCTSDRLSRCNRIAATSIHPMRFDPHDHKVHESVEYYNFKERDGRVNDSIR